MSSSIRWRSSGISRELAKSAFLDKMAARFCAFSQRYRRNFFNGNFEEAL